MQISLFERLELRLGRALSAVSPKLCSSYWYRRRFGRRMDWKHPVTLNEKILWLMHERYGQDPLVTQCADKYRVRGYLTALGCEDILNPVYGVWERPEDIPWESLPEEFVLKCNHGCGYNIFCRDKARLNIPKTCRTLNKWLRANFWSHYGEVQYKYIPRRILAERMLNHGDEILDYKVYCFHGQPAYILVCSGREQERTKFYFFDSDWTFCPLTRDGLAAPDDFTLPRPVNLDKMLNYAQRMAEPFPFVRVDFYEVQDELIFGEMTFTPSAGLDTGRLPHVDKMFGDRLTLT